MAHPDVNTVLVTGAGQGIGKGITRTLLQAGTQVLLAELDEEAGRRTEQEYAAVGRCHFVRTDVSDESSVAAAIQQCLATFGRLDGLVNNAGIANPLSGPVEGLSLADWNRVIGTNLTGLFLCSKHAAPELRRRRGAIVNISSTRALQSERNSEAYAAAKGGVVALTHALAISLGPEVRVNCISPGWIDVSAWKKQPAPQGSGLGERDHAQHPVGRVGRPEDIAALALFLLGSGAGFITGQNFVVDGGMTRKMIYED
jgi:NAD(P)-dependent dehydrogenase (short-subunit alcohol dehydrogenase family)